MDDVLAFDVNETLLDLRALDEVSRARSVIRHCATRVVSADAPRLAFVGGLTGAYVDFTTAQRAALRMLAARTGKRLADHEQEEIVVGMRRLPPHPNVRAGLPALREAGVRQVTLTNSPLDVVRDQLEFAGLLDLFDDVL